MIILQYTYIFLSVFKFLLLFSLLNNNKNLETEKLLYRNFYWWVDLDSHLWRIQLDGPVRAEGWIYNHLMEPSDIYLQQILVGSAAPKGDRRERPHQQHHIHMNAFVPASLSYPIEYRCRQRRRRRQHWLIIRRTKFSWHLDPSVGLLVEQKQGATSFF